MGFSLILNMGGIQTHIHTDMYREIDRDYRDDRDARDREKDTYNRQ